MFWERKEKIISGTFGTISTPPVPAKPDFIKAFELLKDAEKWDSLDSDERSVCADYLSILKRHIENMIEVRSKNS